MKSQIVERLGAGDLLLPSLIAEGLAANDRVKARLSVLQAAARRARDPLGSHFDLTAECRAAGLEPMAMQRLLEKASLAGEQITAPGLGELGAGVWDDVATMAEAVKAADADFGNAALARLTAIKSALPMGNSDTLSLVQIAKLTSLADDGGSTLHRLIMDLHRALNHLCADHAEEVIFGAHVYGLLPQDRPAIEAFMRGLNATRQLKFDHPGLATTATRSGTRLVIQNDIGETDAHVVVIAVEGDAVTMTYTDVHLIRAKFFTGLFRQLPVEWSGLDRQSADGLGDDAVFYLVTGKLTSPQSGTRETFLEAIGAALVFLIDWNKARKVLQAWIPKADAIRVLDWAARHRVGHRAFLQLGGSDLVSSAVRHATPARIGFGDRLDRALGREAAVSFLKAVLRASTEALLQGGSARLARDRIEADLIQRLERADTTLLHIVVRQLGLARDIADAIEQFITEQQAGRPVDRTALAARARYIEEKADRIVTEARNEITRFDADRTVEPLVNRAEETIDELEQAAFVASLMPEAPAPELLGLLATLCAAAIAGAEAAVIGVAAAIEVPGGHHVDSEDAFSAIARLIKLEHDADDAERAIMAVVLRGAFDLKVALATLELARPIERATDRLASIAHLLRAHVLAELSA